MNDLKENAHQFVAWVETVLVPMWTADANLTPAGLCCEALDEHGAPLDLGVHRTLVACRQAYFLSRASRLLPAKAALLSRARQQIGLLETQFKDPQHGGWVYSTDGTGSPKDSTKDLYTYAFIILAYAELHGTTGEPGYLDGAAAAMAAVKAQFARADGSFAAKVSRDGKEHLVGPAQNPTMHLFEAVSHLYRCSGQAIWLSELSALATSFINTFVDAKSHAILEWPLGRGGNWIEPGHQFEWYSLVLESAVGPLWGAEQPSGLIHRIFQKACSTGLDPVSGLVPHALSPDFEVTTDSHRVWSQLELVRALAFEAQALAQGQAQSPGGGGKPQAARKTALGTALATLNARFLTSTGWKEVIAGAATVRTDRPASTPYHFIGCYEALKRLSALQLN